jgi:hypothetical protein
MRGTFEVTEAAVACDFGAGFAGDAAESGEADARLSTLAMRATFRMQRDVEKIPSGAKARIIL